jgi:hypothetical protein
MTDAKGDRRRPRTDGRKSLARQPTSAGTKDESQFERFHRAGDPLAGAAHGIIWQADEMTYPVKNTTRNNIGIARRGMMK